MQLLPQIIFNGPAPVKAPSGGGGGFHTLAVTLVNYTVPADTILIITSILGANTTAAALGLRVVANGVDVLSYLPVPPTGIVLLDSKVVMNAGEVLNIYGSATGLQVRIDGMAIPS